MKNKLVKLYYEEKFRSLLFQVVVGLLLLLFINYLLSNLLYNMDKRGIRTGFSFLNSTAGFGILFSLIDYNESYSYGRTFLVGLINTVLVSFLGILLCGVIGFVVGLLRLSPNWLMVKITTIYIEIFRNIPILLQIILWNTVLQKIIPKETMALSENVYFDIKGLTIPDFAIKGGFYVMLGLFLLLLLGVYALRRGAESRFNKTGKTFPVLLTSLSAFALYGAIALNSIDFMFELTAPVKGRFSFTTGITIIPELFSLCFALSVYHATYVAEAVRAGIESVNKGQREAAEALGLSEWATLKNIIIPQSMKVIVPPTTNYFLNLAKNSSLATAIGFPDLVSVFAGTTLNQVGQAIEIMLMTMVVYLLLSLLISLFMNWYNARTKLIEKK